METYPKRIITAAQAQALEELRGQGVSEETIMRSNVNGYFSGEYTCLNAMKAFDLANAMLNGYMTVEQVEEKAERLREKVAKFNEGRKDDDE